MTTWNAEYTADTTAGPEAVWRLWADVETWPDWNGGLERSTLEGRFAVGSRITMYDSGQDPIEAHIVELTEGQRFVDQVTFPGLVIRTEHHLDPLDSGHTRIRYRMEITGPAAADVAPELGPQISGDFPDVLAALVARAES